MTHPRTIARAALAGDPKALQKAMASEVPYGTPVGAAWRLVFSEVATELGHSDPEASMETIMDKWGSTQVSAESFGKIVAELKEMS